jgi:hypothetical protein
MVKIVLPPQGAQESFQRYQHDKYFKGTVSVSENLAAKTPEEKTWANYFANRYAGLRKILAAR